MKTTESFKNTIQSYLNELAKKDKTFAKKLKSKDKNIDDCITYILNQVKDSGCNGFADDEIYGMAIHYYDEKDVKPGNKVNAQVIVNHQVELSEDEIKRAKQEAKEKVISEEKDRLRSKPKKAKKDEDKVEPTLFDTV